MKRNKLIYGVGINDAEYVVQKFEVVSKRGEKLKRKCTWICPFYSRWVSMLQRCYSEKYQERFPSYKGCEVYTEWLVFSCFKQWMETQDWEGNQLDKDILKEGNKIYSPDLCVFITQKVNSFYTDSARARGIYPIGVCYHSRDGVFRASCGDGEGNQKWLGSYQDALSAHNAWKRYKHELSLKIASEQENELVAKALRTRYL